jgi:hypothetical protein
MANNSKAMAILSNVYVAGQHNGQKHMTYYPAHLINGKRVSQRLTLSVMSNTGRFNPDGSQQTTIMRLTVWNRLADACAKALSVGKQLLLVTGELKSYDRKEYNQDGSLKLDATGQPIITPAVGIAVDDINWGRDSSKLVSQEIQMGKRGPQWEIQGTQDRENWKQRINANMAVVWDGQAQELGYARVIIPQGAQVDINEYNEQRNKVNNNTMTTYAQSTGTGYMQNVQNVANGQTQQQYTQAPTPVQNQQYTQAPPQMQQQYTQAPAPQYQTNQQQNTTGPLF